MLPFSSFTQKAINFIYKKDKEKALIKSQAMWAPKINAAYYIIKIVCLIQCLIFNHIKYVSMYMKTYIQVIFPVISRD